MKVVLCFLIATVVTFAADSDQSCEGLNARAETLYNSTECKLVKAIILGDVLSYPPIGEVPKPNSDIECTSSCVQEVVNVVEGIIDEGCTIAKEGIAPFIYPVHDNSQNFTAATDFVCQKFACVDAIRFTIDCNKNEQGNITPQCFQKTPCNCLEDFLELMVNSSSDFNEDYGMDNYGQRDIMGPLKEAFENKTCTNERQATSSAPQGRHVSSKLALPYFTVAAVVVVFFSPLRF